MEVCSRDHSPAAAALNEFIRPTAMSTIDTASAAERLASRGAGFATSDEVAAAWKQGVAAELADAVMAALGSRFHSLSEEDVCILADLYTATPSAAGAMAEAVEEPEGSLTLAKQEQCPSTPPNEAGGDEAAGSPAVSVNAVPGDKGAISSPEDESSEDESPRGEGHAISVELPIDISLPKWRTISQRL